MTGFFITGTDTDCGKTAIATMLVKHWVSAHKKVSVMKPIASGAEQIKGVWVNQDAQQLLAASNAGQDYDSVNPYVFSMPVSPHLAANQAGVTIDIEKICQQAKQLTSSSDVVLIEGVGGWFAPISNTSSIQDLAVKLGFPVVVVVGMRLGCLNHALLTIQAIQQSGVVVAGWVANKIDPDMLLVDENIKTLEEKMTVPLLATVEFGQTSLELDQNLLF